MQNDWMNRELMRLLVENVRDYAIYLMDLDGHVLTWNEGAERILQYKEAEIVGQLGDMIFVPEDRASGAPQMERATAMATGRSEDIRWHQRKDGSRFWADGVLTLIRDEDHAPRAFGKLMRDSTDRKRDEEKIRRLLEEAQARAQREALLNSIGQGLRSSSDPETIQSTAVIGLGHALAVDRCWFTLYDPESETLEVGRDWHPAGTPSFAGVHSYSALGVYPPALFHPGISLVIEDVQQSGLHAAVTRLLEPVPIRSGISVPLHDSGSLVASLSVAMIAGSRVWSADDVALVETIAAQIRSAMEAARLRRRERIIATQLQAALTPALPEATPGLALASYFRPALQEANVGGDFFDVYQIERECMALVVGDVSGKGLQAAAQVATARNTLRYALYRGQTLAEAITELNRTIATYQLLSNFVTLFVGVFDPSNRTLNYVSCGHEPPLIFRKKTGEIELLMPTGPPVGVTASGKYSEATAQLAPGDLMIAYTDGLSDAGPDRRNLLGIEGICAIVRQCDNRDDPREVVSQIMAEATAFSGGNFRDDISLLVSSVKANEP